MANPSANGTIIYEFRGDGVAIAHDEGDGYTTRCGVAIADCDRDHGRCVGFHTATDAATVRVCCAVVGGDQ